MAALAWPASVAELESVRHFLAPHPLMNTKIIGGGVFLLVLVVVASG